MIWFYVRDSASGKKRSENLLKIVWFHQNIPSFGNYELANDNDNHV